MKGSRTDESLARTGAAETRHNLLGVPLESLAAIEKRRKHRSQDLALGIEALAAVIELIQADPGSVSSNAAGPLKRVLVALHDLQHGAKPALIFERPHLDEDRPRQGGKPSNTVSDGIRGQLAAAVHVLIEAGVPRKEAGAFVARGIAAGRIPIAGLGIRGVTANRVLRWRDEVGAASSRAFNESFSEIANVALDRLGSDIERPEAEIVVISVLTAAADGQPKTKIPPNPPFLAEAQHMMFAPVHACTGIEKHEQFSTPARKTSPGASARRHCLHD